MKKANHDWSGHIEAIRIQGTSARAYAKRHDVSLSALYYWQRKLRSAPPAHTKAEPLSAAKQSAKFVALALDEPQRAARPAPTHCTLVLAGGVALKCQRCHPRSGSLIWVAAPRERADASGLPHRAGVSAPRTD